MPIRYPRQACGSRTGSNEGWMKSSLKYSLIVMESWGRSDGGGSSSLGPHEDRWSERSLQSTFRVHRSIRSHQSLMSRPKIRTTWQGRSRQFRRSSRSVHLIITPSLRRRPDHIRDGRGITIHCQRMTSCSWRTASVMSHSSSSSDRLELM